MLPQNERTAARAARIAAVLRAVRTTTTLAEAEDLEIAARLVEQTSGSRLNKAIHSLREEQGRYQRKSKASPSPASAPDGLSLEGRTREWADSFPINSPADILALPWVGNHAWDCQLFNRCERYTLGLTDREQQKAALTNMCSAGMGIATPATDEELDSWLEFVSNS